MNDKYEVLELRNQISFPIYLCAKEISNKYAIILKDLNLTYTQYIVMMYFWEIRSSNVKELSRAVLIDPSTLTPLLRTLEKKGFITRKKSTVDERNLLIEVTEKGMELREKAIGIPKKFARSLNMTDKEIEDMFKLVYKMIKNLKEDKLYGNKRNK